MREDYENSATRHWEDAELLCKQGRVDNADQLYGIAAECAIKTALRHPPTHPDAGQVARAYRLHVDELWEKVRDNAVPRHFPALPSLLSITNPFKDWCVGQRYHASGSTSFNALHRHRKITRRLLAAVRIQTKKECPHDHVR
jgi:hypothetical protein